PVYLGNPDKFEKHTAMKPGKTDPKNTLLLSISILISLVILEIGLRTLTPFPIHGQMANRVAHPVLGYTLDPANGEVDADGFRNATADGHYDIVVIGDSHTQGFNVKPGDSWPRQLADMLDVAVYNSGIGGYNIYHYPYLAELAKEKSPALVLLALLPSNDLLRSTPATEYLENIPGLDLEGVPVKAIEGRLEQSSASLKEILQNNLAIASVVSYLNNKRTSNKENYYDVGGQPVQKKRITNHQGYSDLSDPVVATSFRNSLVMLSYINSNLNQSGIKFGVIILPSKELIIQEWAKARQIPLPDGYLVTHEETLIGAYTEYFANADINFLDATPYVLEAFQADTQFATVFYPRGDGHPFASGYQSYARAAATLIRRIN
ncbi:GDSL-type esterase/lipase family protein, partial [Gammaproteobacteria bacterium]|nr:GDSL-type esterase/lipase family protein [Gammaproteobacteria bacterium]